MTRIGAIRSAYADLVEARPFTRFTKVPSEQEANDAWAGRADAWGEKTFDQYGNQTKQSNNIDYYGKTDDYIHLKFGRMLKQYNFTKEFKERYPKFTDEFLKYWLDMGDEFKVAMDVAEYVKKHKIPVNFYFNYTDTPAKDIDDVINYLIRENS